MIRRQGFTLVEILLALGLVAILCGMMFGLYRSCADSRTVVRKELEELRIIRTVMNQIARDLSSAVALKQLNIGMDGSPDAAEWVCVGLPARRAWAEAALGEERPTPEADLRMIGYRLRLDETTGEPLVVGIERTLERLVTGESTSRPSRGDGGMGESAYEAATRKQEEEAKEEGEETEEERIETKLLTESVRYLRLRYFNGTEWLNEWEDTASVPLAVEISLGFKQAPAAFLESEEEYPYEVFRRVVFLSAGVKAQPPGTQTKGLGGTR
jgi:prepilin-type N-terminal cleavage/methylation domain-containing protein